MAHDNERAHAYVQREDGAAALRCGKHSARTTVYRGVVSVLLAMKVKPAPAISVRQSPATQVVRTQWRRAHLQMAFARSKGVQA